MKYIGAIVRKQGADWTSEDAWQEEIGRHPCLSAAMPYEGRNPFTGEKRVVNPGPNHAEVRMDGREVGTIIRYPGGALVVLSEEAAEEAVGVVAREVAERLGAEFEAD